LRLAIFVSKTGFYAILLLEENKISGAVAMLPLTILGDAAAAESLVKQAVRKERKLPYDADRSFDTALTRKIANARMNVTPILSGSASGDIVESEENEPEQTRFHPSHHQRRKSPHGESHVADHREDKVEEEKSEVQHPKMGHILDIRF
jgi:hypothetical protein